MLKNQELRYHVLSEGSEGTTNRACNTGRDNRKRGQAQYMDDAQTLFSLDNADGCREMKCQRVVGGTFSARVPRSSAEVRRVFVHHIAEVEVVWQ